MSPEHARVHRRLSIAAVALHVALVALLGARLLSALPSDPVARAIVGALLVAGVLAADLVSGLVHWLADHYGSLDTPLFGPHLVRSFREHHEQPHLITAGDFLTTTGDTSRITLPLLAATALFVPASATASLAFVVGLCGMTLLTAEAHKWAHQERPSAIGRALQRLGLVLSKEMHARHHAPPFNSHYCITAGWWNPLLERVGFFRRLEWLVERVIGLRPL